MIIIKIIYYIIFLVISYEDIRYMLISEYLLISMLILAILKLIIFKNFLIFYISIAIYILPIYILLILETYINKEIIGLGDVKLLLIIGAYFQNIDLYHLNLFYSFTFLFSYIYGLIRRKKDKYIPLVPMLCISSLLMEIVYL